MDQSFVLLTRNSGRERGWDFPIGLTSKFKGFNPLVLVEFLGSSFLLSYSYTNKYTSTNIELVMFKLMRRELFLFLKISE